LFAIILSLILLIFFHYRWKARVDASIITAVTFGAFSMLFICKRGFLTFNINKGAMRDVLRFGIPLIPHTLSMWFRLGIDRIYITKFYGQAETGVYATSLQFGLLISFAILAFNNAFSPYLFKSLSSTDEQQLNIKKIKLVKFTYTYFILLLILCLITTYVSCFIINYFLSPGYRTAINFIPWVMVSQAFQGMCLMVGLYVYYAQKTANLAFVTTACIILQVILSYWLIKYYGSIGAAYSTAVVNFINFVATWFYCIKVFKMPWNMKLGFNSRTTMQ
jgi:O-antigen/teichoic acid export membrane protein